MKITFIPEPAPPKGCVIEFTAEETRVLRALTGNIGGGAMKSCGTADPIVISGVGISAGIKIRSLTNKIWNELDQAGIKAIEG